jgi:AcrR family transcriptional regulator
MPRSTAHAPLTRERILDGALSLADRTGIAALTIRRLADELGVKKMTIYHYVPSKDAIVDGMVERVFGAIDLPPEELPWTQAVRVRCLSARKVLNRHPWAAPLMESRSSPGPVSLGHHEAMLGCLRRGGLSWQLTAHAYAILDSYIFGFAFEEATLPASGGEGFAEVAQEIAATFDPYDYPTLTAFTVEHVLQPGYNFGHSFEFGLDLIITGLDRAARAERRTEPVG